MLSLLYRCTSTDIFLFLSHTQGWETLSYFVTFLFYFLTKRKLHKIMPEDQQALINSRTRHVFTQADNKLLLVPILFVFVRLFGTVRYFLEIANVDLGDANYWLSLIQVYTLLPFFSIPPSFPRSSLSLSCLPTTPVLSSLHFVFSPLCIYSLPSCFP